jgi:hypothetical protein
MPIYIYEKQSSSINSSHVYLVALATFQQPVRAWFADVQQTASSPECDRIDDVAEEAAVGQYVACRSALSNTHIVVGLRWIVEETQVATSRIVSRIECSGNRTD